MTWVVARIKWIMLVSGVLTCSMISAAIAPRAALRSSFGQPLEGPVAEIVVRSWGILIALVGVALIHGAFNPATRKPALVLAGASKIAYITLVLTYGREFLAHQAGVSVVVDSIMVLLFAAYLVAARDR